MLYLFLFNVYNNSAYTCFNCKLRSTLTACFFQHIMYMVFYGALRNIKLACYSCLGNARYHNTKNLRLTLGKFIAGFYNPLRPHSHNNGLSPNQAEHYFLFNFPVFSVHFIDYSPDGRTCPQLTVSTAKPVLDFHHRVTAHSGQTMKKGS